MTGIIPRELGLLTATVWLPSEYPRELKLPDAAHTCPGGLCGIETTSGRTVAPARSLSRRTGIRAGAEPYKSGRHGAACGPQWTRKHKQRATERLIGREFRARSVMEANDASFSYGLAAALSAWAIIGRSGSVSLASSFGMAYSIKIVRRPGFLPYKKRVRKGHPLVRGNR